MARDLRTYEVWLLISGDELYPFSSHGFEVAQGLMSSLIARSSDNIFFNADGEVFKIAAIHPQRNDIVAKAMRFFGKSYGIKVELVRHTLEISELKEKLAVGLKNYHSQADDDESWALATLPLSKAVTSIMNAKNAKQLFAILDLPPPLDCLDLL